VGAQKDVSLLSPDISERARLCMQRFWPGPLSLLLPARSDLEDALVGPSGKVCVRLPALEAARDLCRAFGAPLTSTSANRSGSEPARSVEELDVPGLQAALDGGRLQASSPSTVYDPDEDVVLRQGATPAELLHSLP
jgi:L-threonylcarbamoyladenylate synthase